jgi:CMP-N-acetylneuraminic acid synthetase
VAPVFVRNGAIYAARGAFVEATHRLMDDRPLLLEMSPSESLNIDHPADLEALRARLERRAS